LKETTRIALIYGLVGLATAITVAPVVVHQFTRGCRLPNKNTCIANLKQIDCAVNAWALENDKTTNDLPTDSDIFGTNLYVKIKPTCGPGVYTLGRVGDRPKCSILEHNAW